VLPIVLLVLVLGAFVFTSPLAGIQSGEPLPDVTVTHSTLPSDDTVVLHVTNNGPEEVTISQVLVDEAYWNFRVEGAGGDRTLEPRESARRRSRITGIRAGTSKSISCSRTARRSVTVSKRPSRVPASALTSCGRWRLSDCSSG